MLAPKPYQNTDADLLAGHLSGNRAVFLWHEMGVGKTCIMILTAERLNARRMIVFCPAIARENWRRQIQLWQTRGLPVFVVGVDGAVPPHPWTGWIICNYERLQTKNTDLLASLSREFDLCCMDEHQFCSNADAQRTEIFYKVSTDTMERLAQFWKKVILASGTPMRNSPLDIWPHVYVWCPAAVMKAGVRMGRDAWRDEFCTVKPVTLPSGVTVEQVTGGRNEQDLFRRLRGLYLRRTLQDVVRDMPMLHVMPHWLHTFGLSRDRLAAAAVALDVDLFDTDDDVADALENSDAAQHALQALEFAALARASSVVELACDVVRPDSIFSTTERKVMVLAHNRSVMDEVYDGMANEGLCPMTVRGGQTPHERQRNIDAYQLEPRVRAIVVQLQAGGTAVDLTATTDVIMAQLDWSAANNAQAIARAYRQGTKQPVQVRVILGDTPIERGQARVIQRRLRSIGTLVPGSIEAALVDALGGVPAATAPHADDWLDGPAAPALADTDAAWLEG